MKNETVVKNTLEIVETNDATKIVSLLGEKYESLILSIEKD